LEADQFGVEAIFVKVDGAKPGRPANSKAWFCQANFRPALCGKVRGGVHAVGGAAVEVLTVSAGSWRDVAHDKKLSADWPPGYRLPLYSELFEFGELIPNWR